MKKLFILSAIFSTLLFIPRLVSAQSATLTATVRVNPLEVEVIAPDTITVGEWFDISAEVSNLGTERVRRAYTILSTPPEISVRGSGRKNLGNLPSGGVKTVKWKVKVGSSGNYLTTVEAKGNLAGEEIVASDTIMISTIGPLLARFFRLIFGV